MLRQYAWYLGNEVLSHIVVHVVWGVCILCGFFGGPTRDLQVWEIDACYFVGIYGGHRLVHRVNWAFLVIILIITTMLVP